MDNPLCDINAKLSLTQATYPELVLVSLKETVTLTNAMGHYLLDHSSKAFVAQSFA